MDYWQQKTDFSKTSDFPFPESEQQKQNKELFIKALSLAIIQVVNESPSISEEAIENESV